VLALCVGSFEAVSRSRYTVIGKVDPKKGYRIEFTLASRYRITGVYMPQGEFEGTAVGDYLDYEETDECTFTTLPAPAVLRWLSTHILHSPNRQWQSRSVPLNGIREEVLRAIPYNTTMERIVRVSRPTSNTADSIAFEQHSFVNGYPATFRAEDSPDDYNPKRMLRSYSLVIKLKGKGMIYQFAGCEPRDAPTGVGDEMRHIRDSIRITKVE